MDSVGFQGFDKAMPKRIFVMDPSKRQKAKPESVTIRTYGVRASSLRYSCC